MATNPTVSFVIPTINNARVIKKCLSSIRSQQYPDIEIIIVDGGSTDKTLLIAEKFADKILLVKGPLGMARNIGAKHAKGEILGIFDSDIYLPHTNWLKRAIATLLSRPNIAILWPINKPPKGASRIAKAYFALWKYRLTTSEKPIPGGNILVTRRAYDEVGGINQRLHFGEDYDLVIKILKLGYKYIIYSDPIIHDTMHNLREFTRKQFWGARSLRNAPISILKATISWNPMENTLLRGIMMHTISFIKSIPPGIREYGDPLLLLYLPLLIKIRLMVYGSTFIFRLPSLQ
ncbi:MAG: glycosyltransferase [Candidatus Methanomethylicia archaeon]